MKHGEEDARNVMEKETEKPEKMDAEEIKVFGFFGLYHFPLKEKNLKVNGPAEPKASEELLPMDVGRDRRKLAFSVSHLMATGEEKKSALKQEQQ